MSRDTTFVNFFWGGPRPPPPPNPHKTVPKIPHTGADPTQRVTICTYQTTRKSCNQTWKHDGICETAWTPLNSLRSTFKQKHVAGFCILKSLDLDYFLAEVFPACAMHICSESWTQWNHPTPPHWAFTCGTVSTGTGRGCSGRWR